ncbi:MAG: hypothetical protein QOG55_1159, partial [Acidobacteriaceae bacterium]|nr:hypothetical protein [Acidobacteriaceae bacterium]
SRQYPYMCMCRFPAPTRGDAVEAAGQRFGPRAGATAVNSAYAPRVHAMPKMRVFMSGVTPAKRDLLVGEGDQSVVGDGYAMGVTAQITEHMLRASERWFRIDHSVLSEQWSQPGSKGFRLSEELHVSMKV